MGEEGKGRESDGYRSERRERDGGVRWGIDGGIVVEKKGNRKGWKGRNGRGEGESERNRKWARYMEKEYLFYMYVPVLHYFLHIISGQDIF